MRSIPAVNRLNGRTLSAQVLTLSVQRDRRAKQHHRPLSPPSLACRPSYSLPVPYRLAIPSQCPPFPARRRTSSLSPKRKYLAKRSSPCESRNIEISRSTQHRPYNIGRLSSPPPPPTAMASHYLLLQRSLAYQFTSVFSLANGGLVSYALST